MRADALSVVTGKKKAGEGELTCKVQGMEERYSAQMLRFILEETTGLCLTDEVPAGGEGSTVILALDADKVQIFDRETECTIIY